jgi:hypothetical protein
MSAPPDRQAIETAERPAVQPPRARCTRRLQKIIDLAREAVGWNGLFGGTPFLFLSAWLGCVVLLLS